MVFKNEINIHSDNATTFRWKNNREQTCSCPRGWRVSSSWGQNDASSESPRTITAAYHHKLYDLTDSLRALVSPDIMGPFKPLNTIVLG